ncbi:TlpA family protein disulfide reductase [Hymenobacter sp. P5342]|uniref:TlpA family protein disulfide reductase n=1 Tax=Hymenobacter lapidiphilus TaxID=2608003 RepID=A0A7Y7PT96_9BACT|nr:TlpA family protein disulfide reductase [Hymenobacter lapidiphilus]
MSALQRGLLATGLWNADAPTVRAVPAAATPVMPASGATAYPHQLPLTTLDGQSVSLSDLKGKAVFVNMWASWCPPCVAEMPGIQALYKKMDPKKVAFVLISLDENPAKARAMLKRQGYTFPVYFPAGPLVPPFDSNSIPSTVILGPNGEVAARHEGMADYDTPEFEAALAQLVR